MQQSALVSLFSQLIFQICFYQSLFLSTHMLRTGYQMSESELQEIQVYLEGIRSERLPSVSSAESTCATTSTSSNTTTSPSTKGKQPMSVIQIFCIFSINHKLFVIIDRLLFYKRISLKISLKIFKLIGVKTN